MKVAIVTSFPADVDRPVGGVEAVSVNLVRALAEFVGVNVHVVTLQSGLRSPETQSWSGATIHRLPEPSGSTLTVAVGRGRQVVSGFLQELQPDLVHAHDTYGIMVKGLPLPRVFTVHGFIYGDTLVSQSRFALLRSWLWKRVETASWRDQPNIISISPYVRERVSQYSPATIRDIDNPIDPAFFDEVRAPRDLRIFSAAVISQRKNPHMLVRALAALREQGVEAELRLAGPVVEASYGDMLHREIDRLSLADHVHLLGSISSVEVRQELCAASVFALVSLEENSPMGIEEAMAVGVPVVSSNRCGMPYMIDHDGSGYLVDPFSTEDIASGLARAVENGTRLSTESKRIAERRFHPEVVAKKTLDFYREIL